LKPLQPPALAIICQLQAISRLVESSFSELEHHELIEISRALANAYESVEDRIGSHDTIGPDRGRAA
jgi:hypothetical protein